MEERCLDVLKRAYIKPFTLQSQFSRDYSYEVAHMASRGLITTHVGGPHYGRFWRVSAAGRALFEFNYKDEQ